MFYSFVMFRYMCVTEEGQEDHLIIGLTHSFLAVGLHFPRAFLFHHVTGQTGQDPAAAFRRFQENLKAMAERDLDLKITTEWVIGSPTDGPSPNGRCVAKTHSPSPEVSRGVQSPTGR